jgi:hypothetical protein
VKPGRKGPAGRVYDLTLREGVLLRGLLGLYPAGAPAAAKITKSECDPKAAEREILLNESLAEHREKLAVAARELAAPKKLVAKEEGWRIRLGPEERETLLQILNDLRVGSWRALGEPESTEPPSGPLSTEQVHHHGLMQLAAYFVVQLLDEETGVKPKPEA